MNLLYSLSQRTLAFRMPGLLALFLSAASLHAEPTAVLLPIEVVGADGYTATVRFSLEDAGAVDALYLKAHRLAYRDASTNPERGAKGSVQLNDGPWIDLDNSTVNCYDHEAAYGCLNGAYHTVRLTVPIAGAVAGENVLRFRFNGTDNFSSGYRILEFNLLAGQQEQLPQEAFVQDDPDQWPLPLDNVGDIAQGEVLWREAELQDYPGGPMIRATCADCHAQDGRDLEYFAFSNRSIQERAKFHGLSQTQAEQITSYIRSLSRDKGIQRLGRPWNPPYQPGPGLDSQPVAAWTAGAGLEWVLEEDAGMIEHTFGGAISESSVQEVFDIDKTQNARETPLAIQLPDWQEWLPEVHPIDAPRIGEERFYNTPALHGRSVYDTYQRTIEQLDNQEVDVLAANGQLKKEMNRLAAQTTDLNRKMREALDYVQATREGVVSFVMKWGAVKTWEIMQTYQLEEQAPALFGEYGEPRSWLSTRRNVFEIAPHRAANNKKNMQYQDVLTGKYFSTAWYHLQLIINGGNRQTTKLWPVDWNYQPDHIAGLYSQGDGPKHPYRYAVSHAKMLQQYNDGKTLEESGIGFRQIHPGRYAPIEGERGAVFTDLPTAVRARLLEGMINATMDLIEQHETSEWPRDTLAPKDRGNTLRPTSYVPKVVPPNRYGKQLHGQHHADIWFTMIPYFREAEVKEATLDRMISWGEQMWPLGDWGRLKVEAMSPSADKTTGPLVIRAKGDCGSEVMELRIDGEAVRQWTVSTETSDYLYEDFTGGAVSLHFVNDHYQPGQGGCKDRNLAVDYLAVCGVQYQAEASSVDNSATSGCSDTFGDGLVWLWCNATLDFGSVGCSSTARTAAGVDKPEAEAGASHWFRSYPNPATEQLTVEGGQDYRVVVYDLTGQAVMQHDHLRGQTLLDVAHLRPGVYVLKMNDTKNHQWRQRIVVE